MPTRVMIMGLGPIGAGVARKGWLTRKDVINTLTLGDLRKQLALKRG